jgi:hypothetical protein
MGEVQEREEGFVPISLEPDPVIEAYKQHVDRTLLIENLKLTPTERVQKLMELQQFATVLREAGKKARRAG